MTARVLFVSAVVLLFASISRAQEHATPLPPNTIYVGADGKYEANPDTAVIQFNIAAQQTTARAAYDRASKAADQVRDILHTNSIDPQSAEMGFYSIEPVQEWQNNKQKLVGYRVSLNVTLKLKDFTKVAPIVQQLADADITDTNSVNYTLENTEEAKSKAVQDAYRRVRQSAEALANASGRTLGELSSATIDIQENMRVLPMAQPMAKMAAMAGNQAPTEQFSPQTVSVTAHVNATFSLK